MESLIPLLKTAGYLGVFGIIFAETGLLVGVVFPGDTLLFSGGLLASQGHFNLGLFIAVTSVASILGDSLGYVTGKKFGPKIFNREESAFFKKSYIHKAEAFFKKHGQKTILFARYVPIVRTFAPLIAGVAKMPYRGFVVYNVFGGILWCASVTFLGYYFGTRIPNIDRIILPMILGVVALSFVPALIEIWNRSRGPRP